MAFYDEIGKKISRTKDEAVQKTRNYTEISRLNSSISEIEREIVSIYTEIGKAYYRKYAEVPESVDTELSPYLWEICENMKKIERYRKDILDVKGLKLCNACGKEIGADVIFCNYCGTRQIPEIKEVGGNICPQCGTLYQEGQLFCVNCGTELKKSEPKKQCKNCGADLEAGMLFCMKCGSKVEEAEESCNTEIENEVQDPNKETEQDTLRSELEKTDNFETKDGSTFGA